MIFDDTITKMIVLECTDQDSLIAVRNGVFNELSDDQPVNIKYSVLADTQVIIKYKYIWLFLQTIIWFIFFLETTVCTRKIISKRST